MITDLLELQAGVRPDAPFLITAGGEKSYGESLRAVRQFADLLRQSGVKAGDHVALLADNGTPYVIALLGISWLGAVPVALNNELIADGLRYSLTQSDSKFIIADTRWTNEKLPYLTGDLTKLPLILLEDEEVFFGQIASRDLAEKSCCAGSAPCTILYTSGTTGLPKGVVNSHDCYEAVGRDTVDILRLDADDRIMVFLPLFHTNPQMYALMSALTVGASLILLKRFSATSFFDDARRFRATGVTFVGTVLSILVQRHPQPQRDHGLRFAIGGGSPPDIWEAVHRRFGFLIHEVYGMTEIGGWVSCNSARAYRLGSCGLVRPSMDVRIFDERDRELPVGCAGEIVVRPSEPNVILNGYYNKPEELVRSSRNFWFHTGDRGYFDADGFLYFVGRSKELIRRGGEMISPVEIETKLRNMDGVADCAVVGVDDDVMGEEIKVAIVVRHPVEPETVVEFLRQFLPRNQVPRYIEFLDKIPKTETEKIQRHKLRYLAENVSDMTARPAN